MEQFFGKKKAKKRAKSIKLHPSCFPLVSAFFDANRSRRSSAGGVEPLGDEQIGFWAMLSGDFITHDIVSGVKALDGVYISEIRKNQKEVEEADD